MLFDALTKADEQTTAPSLTIPRVANVNQVRSPPPLSIPERFSSQSLPESRDNSESSTAEVRAPEIIPIRLPQVDQTPASLPPPPAIVPVSRPNQPQVVFEAPPRSNTETAMLNNDAREDRVSAGRLKNPSYTIPQGTVIQAVLETGLDSTRAGGVRALVQRDVSSFDGTRVLIPRGSRLYGEYDANLQAGQNRALVQWIRLIRPDGVTIALDSPSSDPLGRAGIRGRVDSKFLERFGGALLQSVLDIGVGLAFSEATDGVIVSLPGSTPSIPITQPQAIQPTLKVRHGTSVSVFVARDLDFASVN